MLVLLAWTGPPAPARYACTGWDTCPALLAPLAFLALKVLLNATQIKSGPFWRVLVFLLRLITSVASRLFAV